MKVFFFLFLSFTDLVTQLFLVFFFFPQFYWDMYSLHFDWVAKSPFKCLTCGNKEGRKIQDLKNHKHLGIENLLRFLWRPFTVSDASGRSVPFRTGAWLRPTAARAPAPAPGFPVVLTLPSLLFLFLLFPACFFGLSVSVAFIWRLWF